MALASRLCVDINRGGGGRRRWYNEEMEGCVLKEEWVGRRRHIYLYWEVMVRYRVEDMIYLPCLEA